MRTLLILSIFAIVAAAQDVPTVPKYDCLPCAHPKPEYYLELKERSCFEKDDKIFQWPTGDNCPLPASVESDKIKLENGFAVATANFCVDSEISVVYSFKCQKEDLLAIPQAFRIGH
jgi:hypothetical protein